MKKVLMVIPSYHPLVGGAELQLSKLSPELMREGILVEIITRLLSSSDQKFEIINGVRINRIYSKKYPMGFAFALCFYLYKNRKKYDIIHVHTLNSPAIVCSIIGNFLSKKIFIKVTRSGHLSQIEKLRTSFMGRAYLKIISNKVNAFISITKDVKKELLISNIPSNKIVEIPNGVIVRKEIPIQNEKIEFLYVGRLIKRKKVGFLLECWELSGIKETAHLTIVGDGPELKNIQNIIRSKQLDHNVSLVGEKSHIETCKIMSNSEVFVLPSDSEGMSNSLLEAMSFGNVPLVYDIEANHELVINGETGFLFDFKESLVELMIHMIEFKEKRKIISNNARNHINTNFSIKVIASKYKELYDN